MPDFANVLREEVRRLARREIRKETSVLRRASAQYRRDIARLKKDLQAAERRVALLESAARKQRKAEPDSGANGVADGRRFSSKGVRTHRERLGMSAADYGALMGVSGNTVYLWERGKVRPRGKSFAALLEVRQMGKRQALARLANGK
jgi:DNA-binding transcriptional regulator YiaG